MVASVVNEDKSSMHMCVSLVCLANSFVGVCAYVGHAPQDVILPRIETNPDGSQQVVVFHTSVLGRGWAVLMRGVVSHVQVGSTSNLESLDAGESSIRWPPSGDGPTWAAALRQAQTGSTSNHGRLHP